MSLNVSEALIQQAAAGEVDEKAFVETIRQSLSYAWNIVEKLSYSIHQKGEEWAGKPCSCPTQRAGTRAIAADGGWRRDSGSRRASL